MRSAENEPRLFEGLAHGSQGKASRAGGAGAAAHAVDEPVDGVRCEVFERRHARVVGVEAAAGKDEFSRHESMRRMALA